VLSIPNPDTHFQKDIAHQGLSVILASNPRNPTGQCIKGNDLKELVELHKLGPTVILDEFYSWYIYHEKEEDMGTSISGASYIDGESSLLVLQTRH
jgi:aspartate/methionine/tyrosine aminotransferase